MPQLQRFAFCFWLACFVTGCTAMKTIKVMRDGRPATQEELSAAVEGKPLPPAAGYAVKPPLGVIPKQLWMEKRAQDLARAIHEYAAEGRYEPVGEWLTELHELWPHIVVEPQTND